MGRSIKTDFKNKWQMWSSISDSVIYECESKNELVYFIAKEAEYDGKLKAIEEIMNPLFKWMINDSLNFKQNNEQYFEWFKSIQNCETYKEYYSKIDEKYNELLKGLETTITSKD